MGSTARQASAAALSAACDQGSAQHHTLVYILCAVQPIAIAIAVTALIPGWLVPLGMGSGEDGCQVKAEAIHMHLHHPIAQAIHDELTHHRVVTVESVAAATVVVVLPLRSQHVVYTVVKPPAARNWT